MTRVLLVGGGLTSAVTGAILRREVPQCQLILWDKAKGLGGRMSTSRAPHNAYCIADLGAQYISATPEYAQLHKSYYDDLVHDGVLVPLRCKLLGMKAMEEGTQHYVTPSGVSSIVKHFIAQAQTETKLNHHITSIQAQQGKWEVETQNGARDTFDVVVLTMPVPQLFGLSGTIQKIINSDRQLYEGLTSVEYSSRYALGLFYEEGTNLSLPEDAAAQYISNDPIMRFVAIDNIKRGVVLSRLKSQPNTGQPGPSVIFHTSVPFGKAHLDKTPEEVKGILEQKVKEMFPEWPQPKEIKCQKWRFSQVTSAFPGLPGCVVLDKGLIIGGDGFTHSNMDGCIESAKTVAEKVKECVDSLR
ncbi:renalase-like isoform X2 [Oratosquilla oratoria]